MELEAGQIQWNHIQDFLTQKSTSYQIKQSEGVSQAQQFITEVTKDSVVYGVNTGFGKLANQRIADADIEALQRNIVLSHAVGVGEPLDKSITQLMMFLKVNSLAQGYSGIRPEVIQFVEQMLANDLYPHVPSKGSVGASGDLAPLSHFALTVIGEGQLWHEGEWRPSREVLEQFGMQPVTLVAKEGLALLNGVQASNAIALHALNQFEQLFDWALHIGALSTDVLKGSVSPFHEAIHRVKGSEGQSYVAERLRTLIGDSAVNQSHVNCEKVQDPYSLRCQPQVMGSCYEQMQFVKQILVREGNAVSDNPLIFAEEQIVLSGGNFHGEAIAMACDNLALALAEVGSISERRQAILVDPNMSGLPAFLVNNGGLNSGFMMAQVTSAALVSENKALAMPRSVDSIPTSANQEDHVSMATNAALRLLTMCENLRAVLAVELLASCQALDFLRPLKSSAALESVYDRVRAAVPFYDTDRLFVADIDKAIAVMSKPVA